MSEQGLGSDGRSEIQAAVAVFETMKDRWTNVVSFAERRQRRQQRETVRKWQVRIQELHERKTDLQHRHLWYQGRPDLLGIVGGQRQELYHSQMLAWLLNPASPSFLNVAFLRRLLALVDESLADEPDERLHRVRTFTEVVGIHSRTDLVIQGEDFVVAVEVKVDATEGKEQCRRMYLDHRHEVNPYFVFLTPYGREPRTIAPGEGADEFVSLSFPKIARELEAAVEPAIERARNEATPPDDPLAVGTMSAASYLHTLRQEFDA